MSIPVTSFAQLDLQGTYSYADYLSWQFEGWEELLHGRLLPALATSEPHQRTVGELLGALLPAARASGGRCLPRTSVAFAARGTNGATPTGYSFVVVPDLCVVLGPPARFDGQGCLGAPDLIVEVTSPGTQSRDWKDKFDLYEENGVREYWLADPLAHSLSVFVRDETTARYRLVGEYAGPGPVPRATLPDLNLRWEDVFPTAENPPRDPEAA